MPDSPVQEATPRTAPNPLAERGNAGAPLAQHQTPHVGDAIITTPLDEQQRLVIQQEERAWRRTQLAATLEGRRGYVFTPPSVEERIRQTVARSMAMWVSGAETTVPGESRVDRHFARRTCNPT